MTGLPRRVFVESFGCPTSRAEGEAMIGCLLTAGYETVREAEDADVLIYNTCAVKSPTENRMLSVLRRVPSGKRLIVAGCLPLINFRRLEAEVDFGGAVGPGLGCGIVEVVERVCGGERIVMLARDSLPGLDLPRVPANKVVGVVPMCFGCLGACTYCCVRFARGRLRSHGVGEVVARVKRDLEDGAREIWLTSQDTACYGKDIGSNLPELLRAMSEVEGEFFVRVGMMNPTFVSGMLDELVEAFRDERVFQFLHVPVQSGDDEVLGRMKRGYSVEDFRRIVEGFREAFPRVTVATDVICGFPGESEEAFGRTMELVREVGPDVVNVSRFFPRPGTPAKKMEQLPHGVVKARSRRMSGLARRVASEKNEAWVGWGEFWLMRSAVRRGLGLGGILRTSLWF